MSSRNKNHAAGLAALSLCEAIVLVLVEERHVDRDHVLEILEDAAEGHLAVDKTGEIREIHLEAARMIEQVVLSVSAIARNDEIPQRRTTQDQTRADENRG